MLFSPVASVLPEFTAAFDAVPVWPTLIIDGLTGLNRD